jgi:hypothetical protein
MELRYGVGGRTSVAAHVHALTTALAMRPGLTERLALVNSSASSGRIPVYRA